MKALTVTEKANLEALERVIEEGLETFVDVGTALLQIRDGRLYKAKYSCFEDYCCERWGMVKTHANRLISAAETTKLLTPIGAKPECESQIRPLTKLDRPEQKQAAWELAHDAAGKVTAAVVERAVELVREAGLEVIGGGEREIVERAREIQARKYRAKEEEREARREENRRQVEQAPDPLKAGAKFATIVIDPPWDWGDEGDVDQMGRARPTYATMPISEIEKLPVAELADVDCHLYLWITNRSLPKGFSLVEAWGFRYVTCLTWCKPSIGMGNYFRGSTEHVLFAVKGSQPLNRKDVGTWFQAPRGNEHSAKPAGFYELIETCSPGPYLEMFARAKRNGWTVWGAEVER